MAKRDYYDVLGIQKDATEKDIKKAYRKKAMEFHPDRNPDSKEAEEKFKEVNEAYEVLSDDNKKAAYDRYGHSAFEQGGMGGNGFGGFEGFSGFGGFEDIFSDFFGGGFGSSRRNQSNAPRKGSNINYRINISFKEAAFGVEKEIAITREDDCSECNGSGAKKGTNPVRCSQCNGTGQVNRQVNTPFGSMMSSAPCPKCNGSGEFIEEKCKKCHGKKTETVKINKKVRIPAGIDDGMSIRMTGEGNVGIKGGPRGDVIIYISVIPDRNFERDGYNIWIDYSLDFATAALGGEVTVPTLDGDIKYRIPEGTQPGTVFRLRGKGITILNTDRRGDQMVRISISVPKKLTGKQKETLTEFDKLLNPKKYDSLSTTDDANDDKKEKGFFQKVMDFMEGEN